jgi:hypothetical protein
VSPDFKGWRAAVIRVTVTDPDTAVTVPTLFALSALLSAGSPTPISAVIAISSQSTIGYGRVSANPVERSSSSMDG